jgi:glutamine cyclotransferase
MKSTKTRNNGLILLASGLLLVFSCGEVNRQSGSTDAMEDETYVQSPRTITYTISGTIPHDSTAFTQGLEFHNGMLYESTGLRGKTSLRVIDPATAEVVEKSADYKVDDFGEGLTILNEKLYQLTLDNQVIYRFDPADIRRPEHSFQWNRQGWGASNDGTNLFISDGSSNIYVVNPENMEVLRNIQVRGQSGYLDQLNELEFIDGFIYANRWHDNNIYQIDPETGHVTGILHFAGVLRQYAPHFNPGSEDVLNGIAWDGESRTLFVTGKNWPLMFRLKLQSANN